MRTQKAYMNWSGGKDSSLCLYKILQDKSFSVETLVTSMNAAHNRISMHGVRRELLLGQANSIGLPLETIELPESPGMNEYERAMHEKVSSLRCGDYTSAIFGDIFLEDLKQYREQQLSMLDMNAAFPLWGCDTRELMNEFLSLGFKAVVVCVNEQYLDQSFCGRIIDETFVRDLPENVDICGENGEYHSFVFDGPLFTYPVRYTQGNIVRRTYPAPANNDRNCYKDAEEPSYGFYFCDLLS